MKYLKIDPISRSITYVHYGFSTKFSQGKSLYCLGIAGIARTSSSDLFAN
jgi:hypothetical protein